jgi:predicted RNase H-like HicB family nuclease
LEAKMNGYRFSVIISREAGNGWKASCPEFPGCEAAGTTYEEAMAGIREAIRIRIEDGLGDDEPVPQYDEAHFTALSLSI